MLIIYGRSKTATTVDIFMNFPNLNFCQKIENQASNPLSSCYRKNSRNMMTLTKARLTFHYFSFSFLDNMNKEVGSVQNQSLLMEGVDNKLHFKISPRQRHVFWQRMFLYKWCFLWYQVVDFIIILKTAKWNLILAPPIFYPRTKIENPDSLKRLIRMTTLHFLSEFLSVCLSPLF